jgi:hypothetical protein
MESHEVIRNALSKAHVKEVAESGHIRHEWDELKRLTERFVKWCEVGDFVHLADDLKVNRSRGSKH